MSIKPSSINNHPSILVVGGGPAGLALAAHLLHNGWNCRILERRSREELLADTNSFYDMAGSGMQAILRIAGGAAAKSIFGAAVAYDRMSIYFDGNSTPTANVEWKSRSLGLTMFNITRANLLKALCEVVEDLDPDCIKFETNAKLIDHNEGTVEVEGPNWSSKETLQANLVVGADGIHSRLRKHIFGDCGLRSEGIVATFAVLPPLTKEEEAATVKPPNAGDAYCILGFDNDVCQYAVVTKEATIWYANYIVDGKRYVSLPTRPDRPDGWLGEAKARCRGISVMDTLINRTTEKDLQVVMCCDRDPIDTFHRGKVVLVGDAAHPFTPFAGLGSSQAMVDAFVLAEELIKSNDTGEAVESFEAKRVKPTNYLMEESRKMGGGTKLDRFLHWIFSKLMKVAVLFGKAEEFFSFFVNLDTNSMVNDLVPFKSKDEEENYESLLRHARATLQAQFVKT